MEIKSNELYHHGVLGQKWGIRRYQNPDGSLTEEGKRRYGSGNIRSKYLKNKGRYFDTKPTLSDSMLIKAVNKDWTKSYNSATEQFNNLIDQVNSLPEFASVNAVNPTTDRDWEYLENVTGLFITLYGDQLLSDFGESATAGKQWIEDAPGMDSYVSELSSIQENRKTSNLKADGPKILAPSKPPKQRISEETALNNIYSAIEKDYPDWENLSERKRDDLFMKYANSTGMYKYI